MPSPEALSASGDFGLRRPMARSPPTLDQAEVSVPGSVRFRQVVRGVRLGARNIKNLRSPVEPKANSGISVQGNPKGEWFPRARRELLPLEGTRLSGLVFPEFFQILLPVALSNSDCKMQPGRVP